jgi:hypothetical protein
LPVVLYFCFQGYSDVNDAAEIFAIRTCSNDKAECEPLPVTSSVNSVNSLYDGLNDNMSAGDNDDSDSEAFRVRRRSTIRVKQPPDDVRICFPEQQVTSLFLPILWYLHYTRLY